MMINILWYRCAFRYERMTRGRRREHYQWNMDILGVAGVAAEGELLSAIITAFQRMGLTEKDVGLKVIVVLVLQYRIHI